MKVLLFISCLFLSGCASFGWNNSKVKPIEVQTKAVERARLNLADLPPLKARELSWIVITPENAEDVWKKLKEQNVDLVLFAITDDGYEQLSILMAEIRNFIASQRSIILKYKEYYEPPKAADSK
jgi:hypothetical protein